jgi:ribonuclease BN (tRNA processing enzyme)
LIVLGSSAGIPTATRFPTALVLKVGDALYLVDCGAPVSNRLKALGEDPRSIQAVFLTHWHPDHATALPMLLQDLQLTRRREPLTVHGPPGTAEKLDDLLRLYLIPREVLPYDLVGADVTAGQMFEDQQVRVRYFPTNHLNTEEWQKLHVAYGNRLWPLAYGVVVDIGPIRVLLSGDIRSSEDLAPYVEGCSLVSHEFGHLPLEQLRDFAIRQQVKRLLVTHIHHDWDTAAAEMRRVLSDRYGGELLIGADGLRIPLESPD